MAREHISTEQLKHDPLMDQYLKTSEWVKPRTKPILIVIGAIAALLLLFYAYQYFAGKGAEKAGNALSQALDIDTAPVADPLPAVQPGRFAFKTDEEKNRKAVEAFDKVARDYPQMADVANYYSAVRKLELDGGAKGEEALKVLAEKKSDIGSQARFILAQRYQATGKTSEALAEYQKLKSAPGIISADLIDLQMAEIYEATGKNQEASDIYFKIASLNRDKPTSLNAKAFNRLAVVDPTRVDKLPEPPKKEGGRPNLMLQ